MTNKTLLIISGGAEAVPGILRAKAMGLHVVVSDFNPQAPGFEYADDRLIASTYDVDETVAAARRYHEQVRPLDGVICMAADVPLTVAHVAADLGLAGNSIDAATLASDKLAMKAHFLAHDIAIPWFAEVSSVDEVHRHLADQSCKLVIKPVDSRGARGVLLIDADMDLAWAFNHSKTQSPTGRVMLETYQMGPQISTETVMVGGRGHTVGFIDRNYEYLHKFAPYMIENGGEQPSWLSKEKREAVVALAENAARAMGIENGIAKGDMVFTPEGPKVIEVAARLSGGWMSSDQIPLATGVDIVSAAILLALGESPSGEALTPQYHKGVAIRYFFPEPGMVTQVENVAQFQAQPWVHKLGMFVEVGDTLHDVTDHTRRAGFVITTGEDRLQAVARAQQVVNGINISTE